MEEQNKILSLSESITKKQLIWFLVSVAVYVLIRILPIPGIEPMAQRALAILGWIIVVLLTNCLPVMLTNLIFAALIILTGVMPQVEFLQAFGTSPFFIVLALGAVGMGMTRTKFGPRLAYILIKYIGKTPRLLVLAIMIVGFIIVALIVNIPALLAICPVILAILKELGEKPGESNLGKALFLGLVWSGAGGGLAFISSSATAAAAAAAIEEASGGIAAVSYAQWAKFGVPIGLLMVIPAWIFLCAWFKIGNEKLDMSMIDDKLKSLGKMDAAEIRYILILVAMIAFFWVGSNFGINPPTVGLIFMAIMLLPKIGLITFDEVVNNTNWAMCFQMAFFMAFASGISKTGLGTWMANLFFGGLDTNNLFVLFLITILIAHVGNIIVPGAGAAVMLIPSIWAISQGAGYSFAFLPMVMFHTVNWTQLQPIQPQYLVVSANSGGYLNIKDFAVPNVIVTIIWTIIFIPAAWFIGGWAGLM
ncbi:MAG: anion permease [Eubacterium sp.]|nr:anion permease [Eubacterium sp.]